MFEQLYDEHLLVLFNKPTKAIAIGGGETKEQARVLDHMEACDIIAVKIVVANKAGVLDIFAVLPTGRALIVEMKKPRAGVLDELQIVKLKRYAAKRAIVMVAWGYADYKAKYSYLQSIKAF